MKSIRAVLVTAVTAFGMTVGIMGATAATAGETPDALTASVKYSELDINSEQGAKQLYVRLRMASRRVCANFEGRELRERYAWKNCVNASLARAVAEVNVERVTALHRTHADRPS